MDEANEFIVPGYGPVEEATEENIQEFNRLIRAVAVMFLAQLTEEQRAAFAGIPPQEWNTSTLPADAWKVIQSFVGEGDRVRLGRVNQALDGMVGKIVPIPVGYVIDSHSESGSVRETHDKFINWVEANDPDSPGQRLITMHSTYAIFDRPGSALEKLQHIKGIAKYSSGDNYFEDMCSQEGSDVLMAQALADQDEGVAQDVINMVMAHIVPILESYYSSYISPHEGF